MYDRVFGDGKKIKRFLRWRVQTMERVIRLLQPKPGCINPIILVTDLKDMSKRELRVASNQILSLFQDNYPEMAAHKDSPKGESCSKTAAPDAKGVGELRIFETLDDLTTDLVEHIAQLSESSVRERGFFTIALTGGSLISLISKLSENPYDKTVDWAKWHVFWADERAVSKNRPDSNYKLVRDGFLSKVPVHYNHIYSFNDKLMVDKAARDYEFKIRQLVKIRTIDVSKRNDCPKFDLILLEVGSDGHVASLFPCSTALDNKEDWITYIHDSPVGPPERITFTLPVINSASNIALVAVGDDKVIAVDGVLRSCTEGPDASVPATMVDPSEGKLVWFVDAPAAAHMKRTMNLRFA